MKYNLIGKINSKKPGLVALALVILIGAMASLVVLTSFTKTLQRHDKLNLNYDQISSNYDHQLCLTEAKFRLDNNFLLYYLHCSAEVQGNYTENDSSSFCKFQLEDKCRVENIVVSVKEENNYELENFNTLYNEFLLDLYGVGLQLDNYKENYKKMASILNTVRDRYTVEIQITSTNNSSEAKCEELTLDYTDKGFGLSNLNNCN